MSYVQDGNFNTAAQDGAKSISLPFQDQGNYYAKLYTRRYKSVATAYYPIRDDQFTITNLLVYSNTLSNGAWNVTRSSVASSATITTPDNATAWKLTEDSTATSTHLIKQDILFTPSANYVRYILAKAGERTKIEIDLIGSVNVGRGFDLVAGTTFANTVSISTPTDYGIQNCGDGWYLCWISQTMSTGTRSELFLNNGTTATYSGDGASGVYIAYDNLVSNATRSAIVANTSTTRTAIVPAIDADDALAFLVDETEPDASALENGMAQWVRRYANVPSQIIRFSTAAITKPTAPNQSTGTVSVKKQTTSSDLPAAIGTAAYNNGYLFTQTNEVYGILKNGTWTQPVVATGGTFTVTYKTSTTAAQAYNETCVNIATAINALADVIADGLTVSINGGVSDLFASSTGRTLTITVGSTTSRFTVNGSSLTGVVVAKVFTGITSATTQTLGLAGKYSITGHAFNASNILAVATTSVATTSSNAFLLQPSTAWSSVDANTIAVIRDVDTFHSTAYDPALLGTYLRAYTPGPDRVRTKLVKDFYLPGFTAGISSATDIPIPDPLINDAAFLAAVVATTTGFLTYDAGPLEYWKAPIYQQEKIQIDMADV